MSQLQAATMLVARRRLLGLPDEPTRKNEKGSVGSSQMVLTMDIAAQIYELGSTAFRKHPLLFEVASKSQLVAEIFSVSPKTVRDIWSRRTWTQATEHLQENSKTLPVVKIQNRDKPVSVARRSGRLSPTHRPRKTIAKSTARVDTVARRGIVGNISLPELTSTALSQQATPSMDEIPSHFHFDVVADQQAIDCQLQQSSQSHVACGAPQQAPLLPHVNCNSGDGASPWVHDEILQSAPDAMFQFSRDDSFFIKAESRLDFMPHQSLGFATFDKGDNLGTTCSDFKPKSSFDPDSLFDPTGSSFNFRMVEDFMDDATRTEKIESAGLMTGLNSQIASVVQAPATYHEIESVPEWQYVEGCMGMTLQAALQIPCNQPQLIVEGQAPHAVTFVNHVFCAFTNYDCKDCIGIPFHCLLRNAQDKQKWDITMKVALRSLGTLVTQGTVTWGQQCRSQLSSQLTLQPLCDEAGFVSHFLVRVSA